MNQLLIIVYLLLILYSLYNYINKKSNIRIISPLILITLILLTLNKVNNPLIQTERISLNQVRELVANS
jgi:uncharacterized membrane protein